MANFEAFRQGISSSINLIFLRSDTPLHKKSSKDARDCSHIGRNLYLEPLDIRIRFPLHFSSLLLPVPECVCAASWSGVVFFTNKVTFGSFHLLIFIFSNFPSYKKIRERYLQVQTCKQTKVLKGKTYKKRPNEFVLKTAIE